MDRRIEGHTNLLLNLQPINFSQVADTYYFALDNSFRHGDESEEKVILNIKRLLECWLDAVKNLGSSEVSYLPFDFSDQYIGCIRVEGVDANNLSVSYGSTRKFEGSSFRPSQCKQFVLDPSDYDSTTNSFILKRSSFIRNIKSSIKRIF